LQNGLKEERRIGMDNLNYELPELRAKIGQLQQENEALRHDLKEMTASYYALLNRVKELTETKNNA